MVLNFQETLRLILVIFGKFSVHSHHNIVVLSIFIDWPVSLYIIVGIKDNDHSINIDNTLKYWILNFIITEKIDSGNDL